MHKEGRGKDVRPAPTPEHVKATERDPGQKVNISQLEAIVEKLAQAMKKSPRADEFYDVTSKKREQLRETAALAQTLQGNLLEEFGIRHERTMRSLYHSSDETVPGSLEKPDLPDPQYVLHNMRKILTLEKKAPGAVKFLYEQRGIRNFARYDEAFWRRQFEERNDPAPYALLIGASSLEDNASSETSVYTDLQNKLKKLPEKHLLRYIEVETVSELFRLITRLDTTYNSDGSTPIPLVIYDGHGTSERIFLQGKNFGKDELRHPRFEDLFLKHLDKTFSSTALFVFGSCEANLKTWRNHQISLAEVFRNTLQNLHSRKIRVSATEDSATQFTKLEPSQNKDGSLSLKIQSSSHESGVPKYKNA